MSDNPTSREDRPRGSDLTRREGRADATRRQSVPRGDAATRREPTDRSPSRRSRRLRLPAAIEADYEYLHDLLSGGESDIALLRERSSGRDVVLKYYRHGVAPDPRVIAKLKEASTPVDGRPPEHLVEIIDFHDGDDGTWEIQEYCSPGSLRDWVGARDGQKLDKQTLRTVVEEIAGALEYIHGLGTGIAHRDLKPANVLIRTEAPLDLVLADFGLAKGHQALTHLTTVAKGTWHYAAPEVHAKQSSARSDWFSLGAMVFEFYVGRKLFSVADGTEVGEDDARSRCLAHNYSTEPIDDPRWRLLANGLLTWDKDHRWGAAQVNDWLRGKSPEVHDSRPAPEREPEQTTSYRPPWSPTLVHTPQELAAQLRQHWDSAAAALAGRPDAKLTGFLKGFPGTKEAVRVINSGQAPGPKLVRLQLLLDPDQPAQYNGTPLTDRHIRGRIQAGARGDEGALNWLESVLTEGILTEFAEVMGSAEASKADFHLTKWRDQAEKASRSLPPDYKTLAQQAFREALPELFSRAFDAKGGAA